MKKIFLAVSFMVLLVSCASRRHNNALNQLMNDKEDYDKAMESFENGGAANGEHYFFGIQAAVVWIDVKLRAVEYLDSIDTRPKKFESHYQTMLTLIEDCKNAMNLYEGKGWSKQEQLQELTVEWLNAVKMLVNDYLIPLAIPMSIPDDEWKDAYFDFYDKYLAAYEMYLEIDSRWVDFQYEYAAANGFELSDETIDMDPLIKEDTGQ